MYLHSLLDKYDATSRNVDDTFHGVYELCNSYKNTNLPKFKYWKDASEDDERNFESTSDLNYSKSLLGSGDSIEVYWPEDERLYP